MGTTNLIFKTNWQGNRMRSVYAWKPEGESMHYLGYYSWDDKGDWKYTANEKLDLVYIDEATCRELVDYFHFLNQLLD